MDRFEIRIDPAHYVCWPAGGGFQPVEIAINGEPLVEMVRRAEEPFVRAEYEQRIAEGEEADHIRFPAGDYLYLPPAMVLLPSRNLLDQPWDPGFVLEPGDPRNGKATVLGCTCGVIQCWFVQVRIVVTDSTVTWSEFAQFHLDWEYNLGPFVFDRSQYEAELAMQA